MSEYSKSWTWFDGKWLDGNPLLMGPRTHGVWLGSTVFDGARSFEGVAPDLDLHCARVNKSAEALGLLARHESAEIVEIARQGIARFDPETALYIRPMYWAEQGGFYSVPALPESTRFCLCIYDVPMPEPTGFSITLSPFSRPAVNMAPVDAKAACLYPNSGRALREAHARGFDNALVTDPQGNIAELATANVFLVRDGEVRTPVPNGTFLNGITRQRVISLLRDAGTVVREDTLTHADFIAADEIFATGNYTKVMPITRIEDRELQPGPVYRRARRLYWEYAHST